MNIYVGNLALEMTEDELRKEFKVFGEVLAVVLMSDAYIGSGQPRGYGYVEMASKSEGIVAINNLSGRSLRGHLVNLVEALPLSDKRGTDYHQIRSKERLNRKRQRKYQIS